MSDITFKYKGVTKGIMNASGTAKLNTAGLYSEADYVIEYQKPSIVAESDSEPYSFRANTVDADSYTINKLIGGTVAWNQLVDKTNFQANGYALRGLTVTNDGSGIVKVSGTFDATGYIDIYTQTYFNTVKDHKYYISVPKLPTGVTGYNVIVGGGGLSYKSNNGAFVANGATTGTAYVLFRIPNGSTGVPANTVFTNYAVYMNVFDLTTKFGSTIADYVYTLESGTAGAGIAWLKSYDFFTKPYYANNAGQLMSVKTNAHKMIGFNQWDEVWENGIYGNGSLATAKQENAAYIRCKNPIRVLPNTVYYFKVPNYYSNYARMRFYDADGNSIGYIGTSSNRNATFITPENCYWMVFWTGELVGSGVTYNHDICINLHLDGERDGEYEPYEEHTYALDSDLELRGILKLDANNNLYYDGDEYAPDGTVKRKYGIVDLGTLDISKITASNFNVGYVFNVTVPLKMVDSIYFIVPKYETATVSGYSNVVPQYGASADKLAYAAGNNHIYIIDSAYSDAATFKTAMSGVYLVYELATPITESATPYTNIGRIGKCYTESFIDYRTPSMPVGHNTEYLSLDKQVNIVGYSYIGANPVKILDIPETETALSATGFDTWTPSTTATEIVNSSNAGTLGLDLANYNYVVLWFYDISIAYNGTEENKAKILRQVQCMRHEIYKSPGSLTLLQQSNYNYNRYVNTFTSALVDFYNSSSTHTIAYDQATGVYPSITAAGTFSNTTSDTPTITLKTPLISSRCNATYWSTDNAGKVDKANSKFKLRGEVWRVDKRGVLGEMYKNIVDMYNA